MNSAELPHAASGTLPCPDLDLDATFGCGQAFRWRRLEGGWTGVAGGGWWRLSKEGSALRVQTAGPSIRDAWLRHYLALDHDMESIVGTFPKDPILGRATGMCRGLRILRQEPWECLASFICSSTKRIVQIQDIVGRISQAFGRPIPVPAGESPAFSFPGPGAIAQATECQLRECKLGFRAPYLLEAARRVDRGRLDLDSLVGAEPDRIRHELTELPGVGPKIADCVLLFGFGVLQAFPVDVWVRAALRDLYFPRARRVSEARLGEFSRTYFGPFGGYAQQYLFHYARTGLGRRGLADERRIGRAGSRQGVGRAETL